LLLHWYDRNVPGVSRTARHAAVPDRRRPPRGGLAGAGMEIMNAPGRWVGAVVLSSLLIGITACGTTPQTATSLVAQGLTAQLSGNVSTAENAYQQAIKLDRNNAIAHYDLGTVYDKQGSTALAVEEYRASLLINRNFADALFNLAVDTTSTAPAGAVQLYLRVLTLQPSFAAAWLNVGFILQSEGKVSEARQDWAKAVAIDASLAPRVPTPGASPTAAVAAPSSPTPTP
jgi:tetratricopeptide (TPR) repeat protein